MGLISEDVATEIRQRLSTMAAPVKLVHFTQELNLELGRETRQVLEELAVLSDQLSLEVYDFILDKEKVVEYAVDKVPATAICNGKDYGIRFYGMPAGYEFSALLDAILDVAKGETGLGTETREKVRQITQPVHLEVFVTPTCPHCPRAVRLAHQFALENDLITADCVEATEFPELSTDYQVQAVPKTVINREHSIDGALPEGHFLECVLRAVDEAPA